MSFDTAMTRVNDLRNQVIFFWHNPSVFKEQLQSNPQLLLEVIVGVILLVFLLYMLFKPSGKTKVPPKAETPKKEASPMSKTFSKALAEHQKREPSLRPNITTARPTSKKLTPPSLQDLSEEEERALAEAMSVAGKQALAEVSGEPHQAEIFQDTQALDAARKFFSGQSRSTQEASDNATSRSISPSEFIMIYFMAPRSQAYQVGHLFETLQSYDLTLNDQRVFEYTDQEGTQFYVASATKPGQFDTHRSGYSVPGLSFVLDLKTTINPSAAFHKMLGLIHELSQDLKGDILDENRQRLTQGSIHQYMARAKASH